jgi:epsilon-lactone hydrolase
VNFEELKIRVSNIGLGLVWKLAFRPGYRPTTLRRNMDLLSGSTAERLVRKFPNAKFERLVLEGIPTEKIETVKNPLRTILFLHGGGFFMGSIHAYRRNAMRIAHRCKARVFLPEYRLAPEHPYPAALEDGKKLYLVLLSEFGAENLFLLGDSAGGGLVLSTLLALRDDESELPRGAVCICPYSDLLAAGPSVIIFVESSNFTKRVNQHGASLGKQSE